LFSFFAVATLAAVYVTAILTPQMEQLRLAGQSHSAHFRQLHGLSMAVYLGETIFILLAGLLLPHVPVNADRDQPTLAARSQSS
jgi:hypothetical protein